MGSRNLGSSGESDVYGSDDKAEIVDIASEFV